MVKATGPVKSRSIVVYNFAFSYFRCRLFGCRLVRFTNQKHYLQCYFQACRLSFSSFILVFQSVAILVKSTGYFLNGNAI